MVRVGWWAGAPGSEILQQLWWDVRTELEGDCSGRLGKGGGLSQLRARRTRSEAFTSGEARAESGIGSLYRFGNGWQDANDFK
jgi:hypothetical protein